jgi:hypothetical protein
MNIYYCSGVYLKQPCYWQINEEDDRAKASWLQIQMTLKQRNIARSGTHSSLANM